MKKILLIGAMLEGKGLTTHGQAIGVLVQQVTALEQLRHTTEQGYSLISKGIQTIGKLHSDTFILDEAYFVSLAEVNPGDEVHIRTVQALHEQLLKELNATIQYWKQQRLAALKK